MDGAFADVGEDLVLLSSSLRAARALLHHLCHTPVDFLGGHIFDMGGHGPYVTERIFQGRRSIPVELIGERTLYLRTGVDRLLDDLVDILNVEADAHP